LHKNAVFATKIEFLIRMMVKDDLVICPKDYRYSCTHRNNWYTCISACVWAKIY